mgnify:CR=1 FL=1
MRVNSVNPVTQYLARIGARGGRNGRGAAKKRTTAHYKAAGLAGALTRWKNHKTKTKK